MKKLALLASALVILLAACAQQATPSPEPQQPAPGFTLPNALGGEVSLNDYSGEPVFLFFHMAVG